MLTNLSKKLEAITNEKIILEKFMLQIEKKSEFPINVKPTKEITTAAKLEIAETHNKKEHLIKYNPDYPAIVHLVMHELGHLDLVIKAKTFSPVANKLVITNEQLKSMFIKDNDYVLTKLNKLGLSNSSITSYLASLYDGMNLQIYNAPIDLFIEDFLFNNFVELRPMQFLSLSNQIKAGVSAVTSSNSHLVPKYILSASKILNMVAAYQLKGLFGVDFINFFEAEKNDISVAQKFYTEFLELNKIKKPADEYELVQKWGKYLKIDKYFELVIEKEYIYLSDNIAVTRNIIEDPFSLKSPKPDSLKEDLNFKDNPAGQMAVTMYCLDALKVFAKKSKEEITKVAYEIALLGTAGIDPFNNEKKLHLANLPGKIFSGLQLLAYMYVSWQLIDPSQNMHLDFGNEYKAAKQMFGE